MEPTVDHLYRKYLWWVAPEDAPDPSRLIAQLMQLGTFDDVRWARRKFGDEAFRRALRDAAPGVLDDRSWQFWHRVFGVDPIPALPARPLPWTPSDQD